MKNIYFIADAHLSFKEDEIEFIKRKKLHDFLQFLAAEGETKELYILGDLFDFWFEWYHVIPKYWFPILYQLRKLIDSGITVYFFAGNHDFYTGSYLQKEIGLKCIDDSQEFEIEGKHFFLAHGDGYAKKDRGYRLLKRIIRHPVSIFLFKTLISADIGIQMAKAASKSSRNLVNIDKSAWAEEYFKFAQKKFQQGFDYVILGHLHYPLIKEDTQKGKIFLSCGDWIKQFTYGKFDGEQLTLENW